MTERRQFATPFILLALSFAVALGGCTLTPWNGEPEPYVAGKPPGTSATSPVPAGFYRVNPGDTLASVASAFGQRPQDLASWNNLSPNASLSVGQIVRVAAPSAAQGAATAAVAVQPGVLAWPLHGPVLQPFVPGKTKGIVIGGRPGDPVRAAAAGRVVYAGTGIEAYGPLIIVKHDDSLITAYGQNSALLVKEGDVVAKGQAIGQVGVDSRGVASIQFEVRKDGHPVDPLPWLPRNGG